MGKFLIREDYYKIILEILELERISVGDYLENKYNEHNEANPHFIEILYKDIVKVLDGVLKENEGDLAEDETGDFVIENGDFKLTGPINNLHLVELGLHQMLVEKTILEVKLPDAFIDRMEKFETEYLGIDYNTPEYNEKLKALNERIKGWQTPKPQITKKNKNRIKIPKENKIRAELQKEINSICPFCDNDDVGHFEIHHIDEDPSNNDIKNLLLLCRICHSKITKGDVLQNKVLSIKGGLINRTLGVEFVSAFIDSENCSWVKSDKPNVFFNAGNTKCKFPIIGFTFINHTNRTLVLKAIRLKPHRLQQGINGIPQVQVIKSLIKYKMGIKDESVLHLVEPLQLPSNQAMKFDVELYEDVCENESIPPEGRIVLYFGFEFSNDITVSIPKIYLNCENENDAIKVSYYS